MMNCMLNGKQSLVILLNSMNEASTSLDSPGYTGIIHNQMLNPLPTQSVSNGRVTPTEGSYISCQFMSSLFQQPW
jgi:hypothetical protein